MKKIGIISLGIRTVNYHKLKRILDYSKEFICKELTDIENMGNPDIEGFYYSDKLISSIANKHLNGFDYYCLITTVPIEGDYFTRSFNSNIILTTFHDTDSLLDNSKRSPEEYVALAVIQELLSFEYQRVTGKIGDDMFHNDPRGCIFDFAGYKPQKLFKLKKCHICNSCLGKLTSANIDQKILSGAKRVIHFIIKPSIIKSFLICL